MLFPSRRQFFASAAIPLAGCVGIPLIPKRDPSAVAEANNAFGCDLYGKLGAVAGNVFFSPFSIEAAMSMTCAGAKGNTLTEMRKVLHQPTDSDKIHTGFPISFCAPQRRLRLGREARLRTIGRQCHLGHEG